MKIGNFAALLVLMAAGIAYSASAQAAQPAGNRKTETTAEKRGTIDVSNIPLREGTHEVYRDEKSGLRISRIVKHGNVIGFRAVDRNGRPVLPHDMTGGGGGSTGPVGCNNGGAICVGSGHQIACFVPPCRG